MTLTLAPQPLEDAQVLKDRSYERARIGRAIVDWLSWMELGGAAYRTQDQYERDLSRLALAFPSKELEAITDGDIAYVLKTFPEAGRRVRTAAYRSFFKWARQTRRITENPMELLPRERRKPQKYLETFTPAEAATLSSLPGIDGVLCRILLETGVRKAEARNLRVKDTDLTRPYNEEFPGRVVVFGGKGDRDRVVPMTQTLAQAIADHLLTSPLRPSDYWWYATFANATTSRRRHTQPVGEGTFHRWWAGCVEAAGVRYLKAHACRHTYATELRRRGMDLADIKILLGHASIATTESVYVHTSVEDVARRMALIEAGE